MAHSGTVCNHNSTPIYIYALWYPELWYQVKNQLRHLISDFKLNWNPQPIAIKFVMLERGASKMSSTSTV